MKEKKPSAAELVTKTVPRLDVLWVYLTAYEQWGMTWEGN